jgi:hypothetical protein
MSKVKSGPAPALLSDCERAGNHEALVAQLKAAMLAKDERIEQLELANRRLED